MKLDSKQLAKMTDGQLAKLNQDLSNQRDTIRGEQLLIKAEMDTRAVAASAAKRLAGASSEELALIAHAAAAQKA